MAAFDPSFLPDTITPSHMCGTTYKAPPSGRHIIRTTSLSTTTAMHSCLLALLLVLVATSQATSLDVDAPQDRSVFY